MKVKFNEEELQILMCESIKKFLKENDMTELELIMVLWSGFGALMHISKFLNPKYVSKLYDDGDCKNRIDLLKFCYQFHAFVADQSPQ